MLQCDLQIHQNISHFCLSTISSISCLIYTHLTSIILTLSHFIGYIIKIIPDNCDCIWVCITIPFWFASLSLSLSPSIASIFNLVVWTIFSTHIFLLQIHVRLDLHHPELLYPLFHRNVFLQTTTRHILASLCRLLTGFNHVHMIILRVYKHIQQAIHFV